jgi:hypothetical protein
MEADGITAFVNASQVVHLCLDAVARLERVHVRSLLSQWTFGGDKMERIVNRNAVRRSREFQGKAMLSALAEHPLKRVKRQTIVDFRPPRSIWFPTNQAWTKDRSPEKSVRDCACG